ncbi:efflux RND transporter periplasmic adaptor subunit [Sphingobacterium sp. N143]|uniref:efflux RND transporter periplasmic adaptor subunit n=1 Tax=Sphingobacterium sp. N143 TaxID=2746727 RepID=UPI00257908CC|nr:efflux RND transporter periplasmic adaptor subunit [Sphingobacterium sp. N143]MDM1293126.1 efflux RND transporter periplasmic adaptor subunit [Sphingobacterium sp. N143]
MNKKTTIYILLTCAVIGGGYFLITSKKDKKESDKPAVRKDMPIPAQAIIAKSSVADRSINLSGSIDAEEKVEIRSEVNGRITKIYFSEGQRIQQGQPLIKIDDIELQAQLKQVQTTNQLNAENERRASLLLQKGAISQEEFDVASAALKTSAAQIQLIQAQISKTTIRAPFSGTIGLRNISVGAMVSSNTLIANLVKDNVVKITFAIPEKYSNIIKLNSAIEFSVANDPTVIKANIYAIEPEVSLNTRTLTVRARAMNDQGKLRVGSFVNVVVPIEVENDAISIPTEAIVPIQDGKKVFVLQNGLAKETKVETGARTDKEIVILSGISAGDTVLTTGVLALKDGAKVKVSLAN